MLKNQTYLITHAAHDYGFEIALNAIKQGANVIFSHPASFTHAEKVRDKINHLNLEKYCTMMTADLHHEAGIEQLFETLNQNETEIAGVIHCLPIGHDQQKNSLLDISLEDWNGVLNDKLHSLFFLMRQTIQEFITNAIPGRFITVWVNPFNSEENNIQYATLETALRAFCRSVAKEYGRRNICCNTVMVNEAQLAEHSSSKVIELVLFLLAKKSAFITGEIIDLR